MIAVERHRQIIDRAKRDGSVRTTELARSLGVADETIRRDLELLVKKGHLLRTHGGALDASSPLVERSLTERAARMQDEKIVIAKAAVGWIKPKETILLDASTTALEIAGQLPQDLPLRVVSYSIPVAERLVNHGNVETVLLGGNYDPVARRTSGLLTENASRLLRIDRFFYSGGGLDHRQGVSEPNPEQARFKRHMLLQATWNAALIDHSKCGVRADQFFAAPDEIDLVIMDSGAKSFAAESLKEPPYRILLAT